MEKRKALEGLLSRDKAAAILLDPRGAFVDVPATLKVRPVLRLHVGERFRDSDLRVDDWGVCQTLTFPVGRHACRIPWAAVFGIGPRDEDSAWVWPEDLPEGVMVEARTEGLPEGVAESAPPAPPRWTPKVIPGGKAR